MENDLLCRADNQLSVPGRVLSSWAKATHPPQASPTLIFLLACCFFLLLLNNSVC